MKRKYIIYKNDLKFRESREIDEERVDWKANDIKNIMNVDHDLPEYRFAECFESDYYSLDFTELKRAQNFNLEHLFETIACYNKNMLYAKLKCLFMAGNKISNRLDLSPFKSLVCIDLDNNNLTSIIIPETVEELSCCKNNLTKLPGSNNIKRIRASYNKIDAIPLYKNLHTLEIDNNVVKEYDLPGKLEKLVIHDNPLIRIGNNSKLDYLDISDTEIASFPNFCNLKHIVCNGCKNLRYLPDMKMIEFIETVKTPIDKLQYFENFKVILIQMNLTRNISSKYKREGIKIKTQNQIYVCISRDDVTFNLNNENT